MGKKTWDYWFDLSLWDTYEAAKLTVCGPDGRYSVWEAKQELISSIEKMLIIDIENGKVEAEKRFRGKHIGGNSFIMTMEAMHNPFEMRIEPYNYIQWALKKKSIQLSQEMIDWYQDRLNNNVQEPSPTTQVSIPAAIIAQYERFLDDAGRGTPLAKNIFAYLLAAQGKRNEEIAQQLCYAASSITKHINEGHDKAIENGLPSLMEYMPAHRTDRRR